MNIPCRWFSARVSLSLVVLVASDVALLVSVLASVPGLVLPCGLLTAAATGLYLTSLAGMVARLPGHYSAALVLGLVSPVYTVQAVVDITVCAV